MGNRQLFTRSVRRPGRVQTPAMRPFLPLALTACLAATPALAGDKALSQRELNYGYASLYDSARGLRHSDKIFLVKFESEACQAVVKDLSDAMGRIAKNLEALDRDDAALRLDDDGMPELETRKRDAVTRDRLMSFKPVNGRTGMNFERTLLLSESGALNQLQFLISELDAADPDPRRSAVLKEAHAEVVRLYGRVVNLLNREYFK
jgi:hypothetical protein